MVAVATKSNKEAKDNPLERGCGGSCTTYYGETPCLINFKQNPLEAEGLARAAGSLHSILPDHQAAASSSSGGHFVTLVYCLSSLFV